MSNKGRGLIWGILLEELGKTMKTSPRPVVLPVMIKEKPAVVVM
jgi:hypothetical protein